MCRVGLGFAIKNNREYYLLNSDCVLYLCMVWQKDSEEKDILKKVGVNGVICKILK